MGFTGFPDEAFAFYEALAADNTRTFWQTNKQTYATAVKAPMDALLVELADYGPFHVFRPYKDVRFAKDKTPYKDHIGAYGESEGGAGFYIQLSARALFVGAGYYQMASDQLIRFREAIDAPAVGGELVEITDALTAQRFTMGAMTSLKTAPRGYPKDHPRIELLRRKGLFAAREWSQANWMGTRAVVKRIKDAWTVIDPLNVWLDTHVGPSTLAPDEDELARFGPL